nr:hypothetical protein [Tanacetum cinerariifolium]
MLDHQDKYMMKAQVHVSKSSAISDVQPLPRMMEMIRLPVKKLERRNKASKLQRLKKVGTTQRIETSNDTVMDDVSKQRRMIADMDADVDVTLKDVALDAKIDEKISSIKKKPQTKAQARKNMMIYLRNVVGFKMDYFKGMTYDDIRLIFKKKFNFNVAFLMKIKEQMDEEDSRALKRLTRYISSNLEKSKKCSWSSEGKELEAIGVLWCAYYHIYYNTVEFAGREEISTYKVHSGPDAQ